MRLSDQIREEMEDGRIVVSADDKLFPTPRASDGEKGGPNQRGRRGDLTVSSAVQRLLPTPSAAVVNDGESIESWEARRERIAAKGYNGNGMGMPLTIAVQTLLPTPTTSYAQGNATRGGDRADEALLPGIAIEAATRPLLPTPEAKLASSGPDYARMNREGSGGDDLITTVFRRLLPTTTAMDSEASGNGTGVTLTDVLQRERRGPVSDVDWGEYEPAIRQWEAVSGRPAPPPVRYDGRGGKPRLNPAFTEWMMGWPAGWVTGESDEDWRERLSLRRAGFDPRPIGMRGAIARRGPMTALSRSEQLKACGNGVVPQQATLALLELLTREGVPNVR